MVESINVSMLTELLTTLFPLGTLSGILITCPIIGAGLLINAVNKLTKGY